MTKLGSSSAKSGLRTRVLNVFRAPLKEEAIDRLISRATQGKAPRSFWARIPPSNVLYPRPSHRRAVRDGISYELDISDFVEWVIYYGITTEPREKLFSLARPGATVFDIGANVGECSLNFARNVGPAGRVFSFEPNPTVRSKFERNIGLNPFRNIEVVPLGLGEQAATLQLSSPTPQNRGGNRILEHPIGDHVAIRVVRLDDFVDERGIERLDVVKIDVEGFELRVLRGAKRTLERFRPSLFVEVSDETLRGSGTSPRELLQTIVDLGYELRSAEDDSTVSPNAQFDGKHFDVIATPI